MLYVHRTCIYNMMSHICWYIKEHFMYFMCTYMHSCISRTCMFLYKIQIYVQYTVSTFTSAWSSVYALPISMYE